MLIGQLNGGNRPPATLALSAANFGAYPMPNGLTRLESRFLGDPASRRGREGAQSAKMLDAEAAEKLGLVTFAFDDIDWDDEIRIFLEERASFSPDGLTGMEANLRFGGPETMESKIFARLTAWQNWIFQRPNAVGEEGALRRYGTGPEGGVRHAARLNSSIGERADRHESVHECRSTATSHPRKRSSDDSERRLHHQIPNNVGLAGPRAEGAGDLASGLSRLVEGHGAGRLPGIARLSCAPRSRSIRRAGRNSIT